MYSHSDFPHDELQKELTRKRKYAFETAYRIYWKALFLHARDLLQNDHQAADVVQEVFTALYADITRIDPEVPLKSYLYTCVRNKVRDYIRHEKAKRNYMVSFTELNYRESGPDKKLIEKDFNRIIESEIARLPDRMRLNFELSRKAQLSTSEIAALTATSTKTVQKQVFKALTKLKSKLSPLLYLVIICHSINIYLR